MGSGLHRAIERGRVYDLVVVVSLLWFMVQFLRFVFPPLFGTFQSVYGISNAQAGLLFTLIMLSYAAVQFPSGVLGDRFGLPAVILGGGGVFTGAALLVAGSPSFAVLAVGAMLIGLGTGPHKTVAIPLLSRRYADHPGRVLGVMDTVGQFGGMTAPLVVILLTGAFGWRSVFLLGAVVSGVLVAIFYRTVQSDSSLRAGGSSADSASAGGDVPYRTVFTDRRLVAFVVVTMLFTFAWNGVSSFLPLFLTTEKELSAGLAGVIYSLLFAMTVAQTITGELGDRAGKLTVSVGLFATMAVGIAGLLSAEGPLPLAAATVVIGIGFHGFRPVRDAYLMDVIPEEVGGGTLGVVRTFMTGVGALAPAAVGILSEVVGFTVAFASIGGITVAAGLLTVWLR